MPRAGLSSLSGRGILLTIRNQPMCVPRGSESIFLGRIRLAFLTFRSWDLHVTSSAHRIKVGITGNVSHSPCF